MNKASKPPQEKKRLSYENDRRNIFGENSKASRKNIPLSKARSIRSERHEQNTGLRAAVGATSEDQMLEAELAVLQSAPRKWKKSPDAPLGDFLERKQVRKRRNVERVAQPGVQADVHEKP